MFPPYIKMRDGKGFDTKNWHVYTLIGFTDQAEVDKSTGKFTGKMQYTPIYGLVSKKGYKHRGHTVVEYGRETQFDFNKENEWDYREALNNPLALADMASEFDKQDWNKISRSIHLITSLPSYSDMNYAISEQDRAYMDDSSTLEEDEVTGEVLEEKEEPTIDSTDVSSQSMYVNHSGGAVGSDTIWGEIGEQFGVTSKHYYAEGYNTPKGNTPLTKQQLSESDYHLLEANKKLNRRFPTNNEYVNNLLRRNWFQVRNSDAVYAIGEIEPKNGTVKGGTGWAVQMAIDNNKDVYVFDQSRLKWYRNRNNKWSETTTPKLTPNFAGIGTREITQEGIQAIKNVYSLTFKGEIENYISMENRLDLFPSSLPLTGIELMALYEQGNSRISEVLDQMEDLTPEERQTYLNEFAQFMTDNKVDTQDKLEEALRKFICNL